MTKRLNKGVLTEMGEDFGQKEKLSAQVARVREVGLTKARDKVVVPCVRVIVERVETVGWYGHVLLSV